MRAKTQCGSTSLWRVRPGRLQRRALLRRAIRARSRRPAVIARTTAAIRSASRRRRRIEIRLCSSSGASGVTGRGCARRPLSPHPPRPAAWATQAKRFNTPHTRTIPDS